eukprot:TRINITY_DN4419_c0_g1_i1.p2 TRINITY_DN4419_c0_g1~~TRINITY_DN4419_c0_g1_i1.p2  ORF type:complete len:101 (-),score=4.32 TRINITY_DN4419_c0_g1_i1:39-341(-)
MLQRSRHQKMRLPFFGLSLIGGTIVFFLILGRALAIANPKSAVGSSINSANSESTSALDPNQQTPMLGCRGVPATAAKGPKQILSVDPCDKVLRVAKRTR